MKTYLHEYFWLNGQLKSRIQSIHPTSTIESNRCGICMWYTVNGELDDIENYANDGSGNLIGYNYQRLNYSNFHTRNCHRFYLV